MPANVDPHFIIKKPLLTEKSTFAMNEQGQYAFVVDPRATKTEIKDAIEKIYKVKVEQVNTSIKKGEHRRIRSGPMIDPPSKKAIVKLAEGGKIELF
jgi:large subunit ribosomal protein L23